MSQVSEFGCSQNQTRDRNTIILIAVMLCLAMPSVPVLVFETTTHEPLLEAVLFVASALAAAVVLMAYWSPYRVRGLIPAGAILWLAAVGHGAYWNEWPAWAHGIPIGLLIGAIAASKLGQIDLHAAAFAAAAIIGMTIAWIFREQGRPFELLRWYLLLGAVVLAVVSLLRLFRPLFELACEPVLWLMYRVRAAGPGVVAFPKTGPCLIVANHTCWFDPIFIAKVLPRPITPLMTSRFYDTPVLRWLMVGFGVIRVAESKLKKVAPEIQEAIAALDRGECVVIFPEGYLRRSEKHVLRRFGQGVWHLLSARPSTPIVAVWIEGSWGSYTSFFNGPPTRNKRPDFRRPIGVAVSEPVRVNPELLTNHLKSRIHLMNLVAELRRHFTIEPPPPFVIPEKPEGNSE